MKLTSVVFLATAAVAIAAPRPNIILCMADDMGWGDPGYNSTTVTLPDGRRRKLLDPPALRYTTLTDSRRVVPD